MNASAAVRIERWGAVVLLLCSSAGLVWLQAKMDAVSSSVSARCEQLDHLRVLGKTRELDPAIAPHALDAVAGILDGRSLSWRSHQGMTFLVPEAR